MTVPFFPITLIISLRCTKKGSSEKAYLEAKKRGVPVV